MTSLTTEILGLSIAYALLGVLLLTACLFTRVPWPLIKLSPLSLQAYSTS